MESAVDRMEREKNKNFPYPMGVDPIQPGKMQTKNLCTGESDNGYQARPSAAGTNTKK